MRQFFYKVARHGAMLRALLVLAVVVATAIAVGTPEPAVAGPDCFAP